MDSQLQPEELKIQIKLSLVVIRVGDLEASRRFYSSMGLPLVKERHGTGPEHYSAELDGVVVELYPRSSNLDQATQRLGFSVPNVNEVVEACQNSGGRLIAPAKDSPWGRRAVLEDPDGNKVELIEVPVRKG